MKEEIPEFIEENEADHLEEGLQIGIIERGATIIMIDIEAIDTEIAEIIVIIEIGTTEGDQGPD